jgi:predicted methyltransferase
MVSEIKETLQYMRDIGVLRDFVLLCFLLLILIILNVIETKDDIKCSHCKGTGIEPKDKKEG